MKYLLLVLLSLTIIGCDNMYQDEEPTTTLTISATEKFYLYGTHIGEWTTDYTQDEDGPYSLQVYTSSPFTFTCEFGVFEYSENIMFHKNYGEFAIFRFTETGMEIIHLENY